MKTDRQVAGSCPTHSAPLMEQQPWFHRGEFLRECFFAAFRKVKAGYMCLWSLFGVAMWPSNVIHFFDCWKKKRRKKNVTVLKYFCHLGHDGAQTTQIVFLSLLKSANLGVKGRPNVRSIWTPWEIPAQESTNTWTLHTHVYKLVSAAIILSVIQFWCWRKMCFFVDEMSWLFAYHLSFTESMVVCEHKTMFIDCGEKMLNWFFVFILY